MEPRPIRLTVLQPNLAPLKLDLSVPMITLGRATDCTVPIKDRYLSRRHAEIAFASGQWIVRDCGSVNGTLLNGTKLNGSSVLRPGDRIVLGDSEVIFEPQEEVPSHSQLVAIDSSSHAKNLVFKAEEAKVDDSVRAGVMTALAMELIEDRPMNDLFEFILDRVVDIFKPSRAALALLGSDGKSFNDVRLRRSDVSDSLDLYISRTLLAEVVEERNVVSFVDSAVEGDKLARAESIIAQHIRSAICAPLLVGDAVLGVLYLDFQVNRGAMTPEDARLVAQIARFAAVKLETTRLREEAMAKAKLDEELRTAYTIQSRLLPAQLPEIDGYVFAGANKPCRTVSGDYFDVMVRPDGRLYFIIADVSGKGITAALVMASVATAFNIFTRNDPSPADLLREMNATLAPKTAPTKFVTMVAGVLDPKTGTVEFANAGHVAPLVISKSGVAQQTTTDMVVGLFAHAKYRNQQVALGDGDSLVLFTDGVTEAENEAEEQLGLAPVATLCETLHGTPAPKILETIEQRVHEFTGTAPAADDVTMFAISRSS
ncbi:MAG TPA: SpoIIE family protein phosphatase [Thermoanaerobaculia bacterium]|nr:SpoIIE family protein phosphatase [Thermoanaerobaculia bacterium]